MNNTLKLVGRLSIIFVFNLAAAADAGTLNRPADKEDKEADVFSKGSRLWSVTAGRSVDHRLGTITLTQINACRYFVDGAAFTYGITFGYADNKQTPSGVQGGPEMGLRWHFKEAGRWSAYLDWSVGTVFHQYPLARNTLRFNFDVQAGPGATYRLNENAVLMGGFRWHHLSNARVRGHKYNFGYDGPLFYLGLMRPF